MRVWIAVGALTVLLAAAGAGHAIPAVDIRGAAARVVVAPERRADIVVTIVRASPRLPLKIRRFGGKVFIVGDIRRRSHGCVAGNGKPSVAVWGRGAIAYEDLPQVVIRTPMNVRLTAGEAVFGVVGRSDSLDFTNQGCGVWTLANVKGRLRLAQAGSGHVHSGAAGSANLSVVGSGAIMIRQIAGGATAVSGDSGDIVIAAIQGPFDVRIAGSGNVVAQAGQVSRMTAAIAGSGDVRMAGTAQSLRASITGSGSVIVARVTGPVVRRVFGAGRIRVGR